MTTKIGRPTKLTPELQEMFCEIISKGNYINVACDALGIGTTTYELWNKKAQEGDISYVGFMCAVKKARSEAELRHLGIIDEAATPRNWQASAWILERTRPDRYSKRDRIAVTAQIGPMLEQIANPPRTVEVGDGD